MQLFLVQADAGETVMIAPLSTIERAFGLHKDAVERVNREADSPNGCLLHMNRAPQWAVNLGLSKIRIRYAMDEQNM